jgi:hypothetical protein
MVPIDRERCRPGSPVPTVTSLSFPPGPCVFPGSSSSISEIYHGGFEDESKGCLSWVCACRSDRARGGWLSVKGQRATVQALDKERKSLDYHKGPTAKPQIQAASLRSGSRIKGSQPRTTKINQAYRPTSQVEHNLSAFPTIPSQVLCRQILHTTCDAEPRSPAHVSTFSFLVINPGVIRNDDDPITSRSD